MKKLIIVLIVVAAGAALWFLSNSSNKSQMATDGPSQQSAADNSQQQLPAKIDTNSNPTDLSKNNTEDSEEDDLEEDIRPAGQVYSSAQEAFEALKKGAKTYDDIALERFADIDQSCSWCPELFNTVRQELLTPGNSEDEKSYFAEVLAISGSPENISFLVDSFKNSADQDFKDVLAEALEVAVGNDQVVDYLGSQLDTTDESLKESLIAALTNHGSKKAIDILYLETIKQGKPDGYYSLGIGLGEVIPDEESVPYLVDLAKKRDDYSHLAVKALLNSGIEGLKIVMDIVGSSQDTSSNGKLLQDALDHVPFEDDTEQYLKKLISTSNNSSVKEFAQEILDDFKDDDDN